MKHLVIALLLPFFLFSQLKADEGMWLPLLLKRLNEADMKKLGCKLSADEIYNINKSSLKDAIVMLSGGSCSAEAVSAEGLLMTNHHCGYEAIQTNSTVDHDYLADGFFAKTRAEELPSGGITASFLIRIEDVTQKILAELSPSMSESERTAKVRQISQVIEKEAVSGTVYNAAVKEFFNGNEYYLFVYETFRDVRLVGAPPESIGKFGGDTDNWMWPRQTGDFCLLRVYAGPDNKPADYSPDNVPYKPKHFLPISLDGVKDNDFTMVMGYPGRTDRYLTSYGVQMALDLTNPAIVKIRGKKLDIMKADMDANKEVRIKYASNYAQTANYWKYFIGQTEQIKNNQVLDKKKNLEAQFTKWLGQDPQRQAKYGNALNEINHAYQEMRNYTLNRTYLNEAILQGAGIPYFAYQFEAMKSMLTDSTKKSQVEAMKDALKEEGNNFYKDYNQSTDKKLLQAMLKMYKQDIPADQLPSIYDTIRIKYNDNIDLFADAVYSSSLFATHDKFNQFIDNPNAPALEKDLALQTGSIFLSHYLTKFRPIVMEIQGRLDKGNRLFVAGLREMQPEKKFYPNANSTMRLSYGKAKSYIPRDGVMYEVSTTLKGVMEKENPDDLEFIVPSKLKDLYQQKDYGIYANDKGTLNTCFISTNDITGGNSGSPVINGKGHLIGCAFDGNWEAMSGDIFFEDNLKRTISVDIRYVLFIIDKFAGAGHLVDEMKLIKKGKEVKRKA